MFFAKLARSLVLPALLTMGSWSAAAQTLNVAVRTDAVSMDPHLADAATTALLRNSYEALVRRNDKLELEPALALSWELVDPKTWRFKLRPGVKFHDGADFTADDVVFSVKRALSAQSNVKGTLSGIVDARKVDDLTVDVMTSKPDLTTLGKVSYLSIMDEGWAKANNALEPVNLSSGTGNFATIHANGTGAFKLAERQPGVKIVLQRFTGWWDEPNRTSNVTGVNISLITSDATRTAALLSGQVDIIIPAPTQDVAFINRSGKAQVAEKTDLRTVFLGMDQGRAELLHSSVKGANPFKDVRVRQALYHAIDVKAIIAKVFNNSADPAGGIIPPGVAGYKAETAVRLPYDLAKAKSLLAAAGYPNGFQVRFDCPNDAFLNDEQVCQAVTAMLARVGITATLHSETTSKWTQTIRGGDTSFFVMFWAPSNLDASPVIWSMLLPEKFNANKWNQTLYDNPKVAELADQMVSETDSDKRLKQIDDILKIAYADVVWVPLYHPHLFWGMRKGVTASVRPDGAVNLWTANVPQ